MAHKIKGLTALQVEVLEWIRAGQPEDDPIKDSDLVYRGHARKLERLGLVEIYGRGDSWQVWLTELGKKWPNLSISELGATLATKKPWKRCPNRKAPKPVVSEKPASRPVVAMGPVVSARTRLLFEEILETEFHIVARPELEDDGAVDWNQRANELRSAKTLLGDTWRVSTRSRNVGSWCKKKYDVDIALVPVDHWLSDPLPEEIKRHHRAVSQVMKYSTNVSTEMKPRARRLLHQLFLEVDARGWSYGAVEVDPYSGHKTSRERGSLNARDTGYGFQVDGRDFFVSATEQVDRVERPATKKELAGFEDRKRWYPKAELKKFYDHPYNGLLTITIGRYQAKDTKTRVAEDGFAKVLAGITLDQFWSDYDAEMDRRAKGRWAKKVAIAEKQADEVFRNRGLYDELEKQAMAWDRFEKVRRYIEEMRARVGELSGDEHDRAVEWLSWCEGHLDDRNPMRQLKMPIVPTVGGFERERLVQQLASRVPDAEIENDKMNMS
ncbi:hypothetical protein WG915_06265 [Corynebacterium sp. H128]|uniref:hypothetical protein n=1 Tax=Corynebacterium sp. H128 TaxID=3133427 RepID=UPI0030AAE3F4